MERVYVKYIAYNADSVKDVKKALAEDGEDYAKIFTKAEKEATFPGGIDGWKRYLERNLNAGVAAEAGAPNGIYTVKVQFLVDKEGNISNVKAIDVPAKCKPCGREAEKVIARGPKWNPAIQNGKPVLYQAIQFISFMVSGQ